MIKFNRENKKQIARALSIIFDPDNKIEKYITDGIIKHLLWMATERDNKGEKRKYEGQPYWSEAALKLKQQNQETGNNKHKDLRHDHAIPKKLIRQKIKDLSKKDESSIFKILDELAYATIITKGEDSKLREQGLRDELPPNVDPTKNTIFARYKNAGIKIKQVRQTDKE